MRVTDFGLARSVGPEAALDPAAALAPSEIDQTREGALLGTPAYMAPEQLQGLAADARSDQFSFCAALHEALYGERPFAGASLKELAAEVLAGRIRPAARRSSQVPTKVRRALLRGLSVGPELRFPSMEALLQVLERPSASRRLGTAAASLALVGLAVVGLGWLAHGKLAQCRGQEEKVAGAWGLARKDAARAAFAASGVPGAAETWQTVERSLDAYAERWSAQHREACAATRLRGEQSESVLDLRMQCLERRLRELDALARLLSSADATVVNAASRSGESLSRVEDCADIAGLTSPLKASADPKTRSEVARLQAEIAQAAALRSVGKYREAVQLAEGTAASASALGWRPLVAEAQESLGLALRRAGSEPRAASLFEAAWAAEASRHDVVAARAYSELVYVQGYRLGQRSEAHHLERQAAAALERLGPGHEDIEALLLRYSGSLLFSESRFAEAVEMDRRATALAEKVYGAQSLVVADSYSALGVSLNDSGQYEEAVIFHRKALALREKIAGPNHLETASTLGSLSLALGALGDSAAADELSRRALAIAQASLPKDHPDLAFMFHWTGRVQLDLGHTREALELLDRAEKMRERQLGSDHPLLGETLVQRARALLELGRTEESLAVAQRAVAIAKPRAEEDRLLFAAALVGLGQALLAQKQPAAATAPLDQAVAIYDAGGALPEAGAEASFALAQARRSNHQDPSRALRLGQRAQEGFLKAGKRSAARARAVDAWLGP